MLLTHTHTHTQCSVCVCVFWLWSLTALTAVPPPAGKMKFIIFLLSIGGFSHLWGDLGSNYSLECLNDYLFTITCVLNTSAGVLPHSATYWLELYDFLDMDRGHRCVLKAQTHAQVCVLDVSPWLESSFSDTDIFQIFLNSGYHGNSSSVVLEMVYMPVKHIRPVPPTNLSLLWENDKVVFYWLSGYQENSFLVPHLLYQLSIRSKDQVLDVELDGTTAAVEVASHTQYSARVRSVPNQIHYQGVWSHWGSAIHWTTGSNHSADNLETSMVSKWFALTSLLSVLLLIYISYSWCKRQVRIPSPAPYFRDFKSPVVLSDGLLQREVSLKIDSMFEDFDTAPQSSPTHDEGISVDSGHAFIPAPPNLPSMLHCTEGAEVSSSGWLRDVIAAKTSSVTYNEDYCAVSHTD
ncbi:interleukin-21 receptor [Brachyhypopomus gauderio]|uniref:interleukin-21 receptor n=1 Tax=Brachyhypopomus gauderio TaxID=698409 RepID=UPI004040F2B6